MSIGDEYEHGSVKRPGALIVIAYLLFKVTFNLRYDGERA
jgi:hypothetical protein